MKLFSAPSGRARLPRAHGLTAFRVFYCTAILCVVFGMVASTRRMPVTIAQTPPSYFTIVGFADVHLDDNYGNPLPQNVNAWAAAKVWMINNRAAWNIQGAIGAGDYI